MDSPEEQDEPREATMISQFIQPPTSTRDTVVSTHTTISSQVGQPNTSEIPAAEEGNETVQQNSSPCSPSTATSDMNQPQNLSVTARTAAMATAKPAEQTTDPSKPIRTYELVIRQQPLQARMSGLSIKDRRLIDPPPIVECVIRETKSSSDSKSITRKVISYTAAPYLVVHASLWSASNNSDSPVSAYPPTTSNAAVAATALNNAASLPPISATSLVQNTEHSLPGSGVHDIPPLTHQQAPPIHVMPANVARPLDLTYTQVLLGSLVTPCHVLYDIDGERGMFFVFSDLSVRTSGKFRLRFSLFDISCRETSTALATVVTDVFTVYSPKTFLGMRESTELTKTFARQGLRIHVRNESKSRRKSVSTRDEEEDEEDDAPGLDVDMDMLMDRCSEEIEVRPNRRREKGRIERAGDNTEKEYVGPEGGDFPRQWFWRESREN